MKRMRIGPSHVIGHSVEGRPISLRLFGDPPDPANLEALFIGVFHGDEGISAELLESFITHLDQERPVNPDIPFGIVPILNPDGLAANTRVNANGVDLNRNYPTDNWQLENEGTMYYSGKAPGSEPETRLVIDLIDQYSPRKIITVHSPYKVLNYDGPALWLAEAMAVHSGYKVVADIGYPTPGSFGTYAGIERQIPVVTLELPEDEPLETVWADNRDALIAAILAQPAP